MPESQIDLSRLALDRTSQEISDGLPGRPRRKWISRYLVPSGILLGFATLMMATAGQSLWPHPVVEIVPVVVKRAALQRTGLPLFKAAGWIEPRPTAINVPALAPGVIESLLVVEGQAVQQGEPIARLISIDAEIGLKQTQASLATAEGELKRALAEQHAAKIRLEQPVHVEIELADAKSLLAKVQTEMTNLPFQIETAQASLEYNQKSVGGKRAAGNAVPGVVLQKAELELAAADAKLRELQTREPSLKREVAAIQEKVNAIEKQLRLLVDETRQLAESEAKVQSATALLEAAQLRLQAAELRLSRNTIRAPMDGRILELVAAPGMRVMGLESGVGHNSSSVVEMYDPNRLQVRADVRLEDVPLVQQGQPVEIETASSEKMIRGRVLQSNSNASIQKNTLEVKVELLNPPETVRPDMLVTATFLSPQLDEASPLATQEKERMLIPQALLFELDSVNFVWIVDSDDRARRIEVDPGRATSEGLIEIIEGLRVTDKLIATSTEYLNDGTRVSVTGEDGIMGR